MRSIVVPRSQTDVLCNPIGHVDLIRNVDAARGMTFVMEYPSGNLGSVSG